MKPDAVLQFVRSATRPTEQAEFEAARVEGVVEEAFDSVQQYLEERLDRAVRHHWVPGEEMPDLARSFLFELEEAIAVMRHRLNETYGRDEGAVFP